MEMENNIEFDKNAVKAELKATKFPSPNSLEFIVL